MPEGLIVPDVKMVSNIIIKYMYIKYMYIKNKVNPSVLSYWLVSPDPGDEGVAITLCLRSIQIK